MDKVIEKLPLSGVKNVIVVASGKGNEQINIIFSQLVEKIVSILPL